MKKVIVKTNLIVIYEEDIPDNSEITQNIIDGYNEGLKDHLKTEGVKTIHIESNFEVKNYEEQDN